MLDTADKPINPRAASEYLAGVGFPLQESTLCKLRCIGGGPVYLKHGSRVFYRPSALHRMGAESHSRTLPHQPSGLAAMAFPIP